MLILLLFGNLLNHAIGIFFTNKFDSFLVNTPRGHPDVPPYKCSKLFLKFGENYQNTGVSVGLLWCRIVRWLGLISNHTTFLLGWATNIVLNYWWWISRCWYFYFFGNLLNHAIGIFCTNIFGSLLVNVPIGHTDATPYKCTKLFYKFGENYQNTGVSVGLLWCRIVRWLCLISNPTRQL